MERQLRCNVATVVGLGIVFLLTTPSHADDMEQHLRDEYHGKIFVLRGFYSGERLRYDSAGVSSGGGDNGDWTTDGFVQVDDIHASGQTLKIKAKRLMAVSAGREGFRLAAEETPEKHNKPKKAVLVEIDASLGAERVTEEKANAVLSRIFLSSQEQFADFVPAFWKPCVEEGMSGKNEACRFSSEMAAVPGMNAPTRSTASPAEAQASVTSSAPPNMFRTNFAAQGIKPPKVVFQPEPSFSEPARRARYQGVVTMGVTVDKDGRPSNIHIISPLGAGLDAKAVQAVQTWKFQPAQKGGEPVAVQIAVEVDFHLF